MALLVNHSVVRWARARSSMRNVQSRYPFLTPKQHSYDRQELIRCGHGEVFGKENAKLPLPNMLMFDRVTEINDSGGQFGKGQMIAELDINPLIAGPKGAVVVDALIIPKKE